MPQLRYSALSRLITRLFADGQITTRQLPQRPQSVLSVIDRAQHSTPQQLGQLSRIYLVVLAALFQ
jgi:hypothetical protein